MQGSKQTRDMFLTRALQRILEDREIKRSYNSELRQECKKTLEKLKNELQASGVSEDSIHSQFTPIEADSYFPVFELACKSRSPSIVRDSLDCLQKMIVYGMLVGNLPDDVVTDQKPIINRVIEAICECFTGVNTNEDVQLQIIKVLLTAVTSNNCEVHDAILLQAVRTCYNIYLASRNVINQTTAKTTLTQMLNVIFSRMEAQAEHDKKLKEKLELENTLQKESNTEEQSSCSDVETISEKKVASDECENKDADDEGFADFNGFQQANDNVNGVTDSSDDVSAVVEEIMNDLLNNVNNIVTNNEGEQTFETIKKNLENGDESAKVTKNYSSNGDETPDLPNGDEVQQNGCTKEETQVEEVSVKENDVLRRNLSVLHALQKDAFLVFRSFCKLSMKQLSDGPPDPKSHELRSKILSLELLSSILGSAGPVFRENPLFISAIQQYLCVALSNNAVSNVPQVFELSLEIFVKLLKNFKTHLKGQIQVFFKDIFLNMLDASSSSLLLKSKLLDCLLSICQDAQSIVDIYVNYDCDMSAANIFEQLVSLLRKTAQIQDIPVSSNAVANEIRKMRKKSLECLVTLVKSLVEWCNDLYVNPQSMTNLGKEHQTTLGEQSSSQLASNNFHGSSTMSMHSDSSDATMNSSSVQHNPDVLEDIKQQKDILEQGIFRFNSKPTKGVIFLQNNQMIGASPMDVAKFLQTESRLDPTMVGEFLGENETFNKEVMYAYVDSLNFTDKDFVSSIRLFLEGFRIPGEAQKIDRLMEKFASRYLDCNPHGTVFASADAAYVLAYSIIMLTTDQHSAQVKRKMTSDDYIKMNRGINDSKDLPREYLEGIYSQIKEKGISLKDERNTVSKQNATSIIKGSKSAAQRMREMQEMADNAKVLMEAASKIHSEFISAEHLEHVRPMFKKYWNQFMVAFSIAFHDKFEDKESTLMCLKGFQYSIRIACIFGLSLERDSLINTLSRCSLLEDTVGIRELEWKNREAIKTLIQVACTDGNYLQQSWKQILRCISHLDLIQSIGSGVNDHQITAIKKNAVVQDSNQILTKTFGIGEKRLATIQESMGETSSQSYVVAVDKIFTGSERLDEDAIVDFVDCLCEVSLSELNNPLRPRKFSLQKIVEISYYNMGRVRLHWSRIWAILGEHFNVVGCSEIEEVAVFAVDSLRQLSMKFLEKGELPGFSFQKDFLRPFEHIVKHNPRDSIKDMVVRCIQSMVHQQVKNIKSGWKNIFSVFTTVASFSNEELVELAFTITSAVMTQHFEFYFSSIIYCFQDAVVALREFSCCLFPDTSMEAIRLIRQCANYVAEKPKYFEDLTGDESQYKPGAADKIWVRGWFPIFFELSCIINRCKLDVRTRGLTVMFEIMKTYGETFHQSWWHDLFQIIFRIFDQMKMPEVQLERTDWFATTCNHALFSVCDVFSQYYTTLAPTLLHGVYDQLLWCIEKENEQLARSGVNCFENLVISNGHLFDHNTWELTCEKAIQIFTIVSPNKLLTWDPNRSHDQKELKRLQLFCILTSEMIECIDNFLFMPKATKIQDEANLRLATTNEVSQEPRESKEMFKLLSENQLLLLVHCLHKSHDLAKRFNSNINQREILWKHGLKGKSLPNLILQETTSLTCALRILFRLHENSSKSTEKLYSVLSKTCGIAMNYYITIQSQQHRESWSNILLLILAKLVRMPDDKFMQLSTDVHPYLCDIMLHDFIKEVRLLLRKFFVRYEKLRRISPIPQEDIKDL